MSGWPSSDAEMPNPVVKMPSKSDWSTSRAERASCAPAIQKVGPDWMRARSCCRKLVVMAGVLNV